MEIKLYSFKDTKVGEFMNVVQAPNDQVMVRNVRHALRKKDSDLYLNASDLDLYCLGSYDTKTGAIIPEVTFVVNAGGLVDAV